MTVIIIIIVIILIICFVKKASKGNGVIGRVKNGDYGSAAELAKMKAARTMHEMELTALNTCKDQLRNKKNSAKTAEEREHYSEQMNEAEMRIRAIRDTIKSDEKAIYNNQNNFH